MMLCNFKDLKQKTLGDGESPLDKRAIDLWCLAF